MAIRGEWRPVLDGADAARARAAIAAVADAVDALADAAPGLADGHAGFALLHAYRAADGEPDAAGRAAAALARAVDGLAAAPAPSLFSGYPGIAWVLHHLRELVEVEPGTQEEIDAMVAEALAPPWAGDVELLYGLVGLGVYGLERGAAALVDRTIDHLWARAVKGPEGAAWPVRDARWLRPDQRAANPDGILDLGVAHGAAGVVGFLAQCLEGDPDPRTRGLLVEGVRGLRLHQRAERPRFDRVAGIGLAGQPLTDGWCYGDPGVATMLVNAGLAAEEPEWVEAGRALIAATCDDSCQPGGRFDVDLSLCHGTAGRAHLAARIGHATGDGELVAAARRWYRYTIDAWSPGTGVGGFVSPGPATSAPQVGALMGAASIALALLAAVSPVEPAWDRLFLIGPAPPA